MNRIEEVEKSERMAGKFNKVLKDKLIEAIKAKHP